MASHLQKNAERVNIGGGDINAAAAASQHPKNFAKTVVKSYQHSFVQTLKTKNVFLFFILFVYGVVFIPFARSCF